METPPAQINQNHPRFSLQTWLLWFFPLLVPFAFVSFLLIFEDQGLFELVYVFHLLFVFVSPFVILAAIRQWIYFCVTRCAGLHFGS